MQIVSGLSWFAGQIFFAFAQRVTYSFSINKPEKAGGGLI